jgi:hypothetical protein
MTITIPWNDGPGNIVLTYTGQGDGTVTVTSDTDCIYHDRQQRVTFVVQDGAIRNDVGTASGHYIRTASGNTIRTLFSRDSSATYLGDTPQVPPLILGHSYWTNTPVSYMKRIRQELRDTCRRYGIKFWQSEICIMSNDHEIGGGGGYDFTMKTGLYVARVIHHDLSYADAESWSWWRACGGNYKDGLIRVYDRRHEAQDSRLMWCLGNYSRFVRPGAVRYEVSAAKPVKGKESRGVMVSAYRNAEGSWAVVAINYSGKQQPFSLSFSDEKNAVSADFIGKWYPYRTSDAEGETLCPLPPCEGKTTLAPRSITTFVTKKLNNSKTQ